jgi:hypothetical protein
MADYLHLTMLMTSNAADTLMVDFAGLIAFIYANPRQPERCAR